MEFVPTCWFKVWLPKQALFAGERNQGFLDLVAPKPIERADRVDLLFRSVATAGYGSGRSRRVVKRAMFTQPLRLELPTGLAAGTHRYPFVLDVPAALHAEYHGADCSLRNLIELRLDVDWAVDPVEVYDIPLVPVPHPRVEPRRPFVVRSPDHFHEALALELTLDSTVVARGEPLEGQLALRTGHQAEFNAIFLRLMSRARVTMSQGDFRFHHASTVTVPAEALRSGRSVPFRFPTDALPASQVNGFLDLDSFLQVVLDASWWTSNRSFSIDLEVRPRGSHVAGGGSAGVLLGGSRMGALSFDLGSRTGLRVGAPPVLVYGREGPVDVAVSDGSRGSEFAAVETYAFPDLRLGIRSRPLGILPAGGSLAPPPLDARYAIRCDDGLVPEPALRAFFAEVLRGVEPLESLELSDHQLTIRRDLGKDDPARWLAVAAGARDRARAIGSAIAALPFAVPEARDAWNAAAAAESAVVLPHLPALVFVRRAVRTAAGEQHELVCALTTLPGPKTRLDVLVDGPLPPEAISALHAEEPDELVAAMRQTFESLDAPSSQHVVAVADGFARDPRTTLAALEPIIAFWLRARGERRVDTAYR